MYKIIAEQLRAKIESGEYRPGQQLPTELELRDQYNASRNTVRDAIKTLVDAGLIEALSSRGTFVKQSIVPFEITVTKDPETGFGGSEGAAYEREISDQGRVPSASAPRVEIQTTRPDISVALALEPDAHVISRHQERFIDGIPFSLQTSFYPRGLVQRGADRLMDPVDLAEGTVHYLSETLGLEQVGYKDTIRVRPVDETEERFFDLRASSQRSVIEHKRIAYAPDGVPIRLTITVFHPDRAEITINEGEVPS
ncbi:GntR family transcriptional regulator [Actinoplanes sp. NPDC048967]|uniref:GntR family transcriptional regulator n=1 Tax=Actinoplanes sp. NPDC048967 TaxID=3155269 RepID=UPI0033FA0650